MPRGVAFLSRGTLTGQQFGAPPCEGTATLMESNDVWAELRDMQAHERVSLVVLV